MSPPVFLLVLTSHSTPTARHALSSGSNIRGAGVGWRLSSAYDGNARRIRSALATFANSIISSTIWLASLVTYIPTSSGWLVSLSISNRTSGDARVRAPASILRLRSDLAHALMFRRSFARGDASFGLSIMCCASA